MITFRILIFFIVTLFVTAENLRADVSLPAVFTDHMILQRGKPVQMWGTADPKEKVKVTLKGKTTKTTANKNGRWKVTFPAQKMCSQSFSLIVEGKNKIILNDILIGDVWVASGQSNMAWYWQNHPNDPAIEKKIIKNDKLRLFKVVYQYSEKPAEDVKPAGEFGGWQPAVKPYIDTFSAAAIYFAEKVQQKTGVPIGVIMSSVGGTCCEAWTPKWALESNEITKDILRRYQEFAKEKGGAAVREKWEKDVKAWWEKKGGKGRFPAEPPGEKHTKRPAGLYNGMLAPLHRFPIKGVIWYQGEGNSQDGSNGGKITPYKRCVEHRTLFKELIKSWRKGWNQPSLPFLFVQLAPFRDPKPLPSDENWPWLRESQAMARELPNTAMACIIDKGQSDNIHPDGKDIVGHRLALCALKKVYGKKYLCEGPQLDKIKVNGKKVLLTFKKVGAGLETREVVSEPSRQGIDKIKTEAEKKEFLKKHRHVVDAKPLRGFSIAGDDRKFCWAFAKIVSKNQVLLWNPGVKKPVAVRYAWSNFPLCNLYNSAGLPAEPFRTDQFDNTLVWGHSYEQPEGYVNPFK